MAEIPTKEEHPFSKDLKVLAIDKDPTVLQIIEKGCAACRYQVILCSDFQVALNHLGEVNLVLTEVEMPNKDGYKFIHHVSKEVGLPIIAMSNDDSERLRLKAFEHGACHYIKKPLNEEHFRHMWHPLATKASKENKFAEKFVPMEDDDLRKRGNHDSESAAALASVIEATGVVRNQKRHSPSKQSDGDEADDYFPPPAKKTRVIWSAELHDKFVKAVMQIGLDKAVPKKILEVMNVPGLTRENVASHLQKFRHQLKGKYDETTRQQNGMMSLSNTIPRTIESRAAGASGGFDFQPLAGNSHASYHPEFNTTLIPIEQNQWPNHSHAAGQGLSYDHPITKSPSNMSLDDESRYRSAWLASNAPMGVNGSVEKHGNHINNVLMNPLQQQQQSLMNHQSHINPASVTQNPSFSRYAAAATPVSVVQQGLTNVAVTVSDTQFPYGPESNDSLYHESLNPGYDGNQMYIPTKPAGFENKSSQEDEDYTLS